MLTIGQLARYAGVTARAVRHYHRIGLLPEPERDSSGYRSYDAAGVVRLIRIRTLASAGVPLARVQELLDASPEDFAAAIDEIDRGLRAEIRRLQENRKRIARLAAGESLALPPVVVGYLDRLRGLGVSERYIELERDSWIMLCRASAPPHARHHRDEERGARRPRGGASLPAPQHRRRLGSRTTLGSSRSPTSSRGRCTARWRPGTPGVDELDDPFVELLDTATVQAAPGAARLLAILEERGWRGWTRVERVDRT